MKENRKRRGRPPTTFEDYPIINEAYAGAREVVLAIVHDFNDSNPEGLGYWALDRPVFDFVQSCIPRHLNPDEIGANTLNIQKRARDILEPFLRRGDFTQDEFSEWLSDTARAIRFTNQWMRDREPQPPRGKQPRIGFRKLIEAGLLKSGAVIRYSIDGKDYSGEVTIAGRFRCNMGDGLRLYRSPNDAVTQTFNKVFNQWKACVIEDSSGKLVPLERIRSNYKKSIKVAGS